MTGKNNVRGLTSQEIGDEFEKDFTAEMGLTRTPGSGAFWYSKLDTTGEGVRWSLKATTSDSVRVSLDLIYEAIKGCDDGSIPMWAFRIQDIDMVMMFKDDFIAIQAGELNVVNAPSSARRERKARADMPQLLRGDN